MSAPNESILNNNPRGFHCHGTEHFNLHWVLEIVKFLTSVGRRLFSISLNLHSTGDSAVGFSTGEIGDVNESVVEGGKEMNNTEVVDFSSGTSLWWTEIGLFFFLNFNFLLWWL